MMPVVETIIRTKSIHLVRESVHLSEFPNFTIYGCGKLTCVEIGETNHLDHLQHYSSGMRTCFMHVRE